MLLVSYDKNNNLQMIEKDSYQLGFCHFDCSDSVVNSINNLFSQVNLALDYYYNFYLSWKKDGCFVEIEHAITFKKIISRNITDRGKSLSLESFFEAKKILISFLISVVDRE